MIVAASASWLPAGAAIAVAVSFYLLVRRADRAAAAVAPAIAAPVAAVTDAAKQRDGGALRLDSPMIGVVGILIAGALWILADRFGLALGFIGLWYAALMILRTRRRTKQRIEDEKHALSAIRTASRALRAGIPVTGMIEILAKGSHGEAGRAFRDIKQREELGEELTDSIRKVLVASKQPALRAFGLALLLQLSAGGNIADTSDRLTRALVERNRIRRRSRTILTYSRTAAFVMAPLPVLAVPILCANLEGYAEFVFDRPAGNMVLAISAVLVAAGLILTQRLAQVELSGARRDA